MQERSSVININSTEPQAVQIKNRFLRPPLRAGILRRNDSVGVKGKKDFSITVVVVLFPCRVRISGAAR